MSKIIKRYRSKLLAVVVITIICQILSPIAGLEFLLREKVFAEEARSLRLPASAEVMDIPLKVSWPDVPEEDIPDQVSVTAVPDGIAFMATDVFVYAKDDWQATFLAPMGTRSIQLRNLERPGFEYRILGSLEDSYTIEYYLAGQMPEDGASLAEQNLPLEPYELPDTPTQTVKLNPDRPIVQTKEGESLSEEELRDRYVEEQLRMEGYNLNRTPYYIAIGICVALIIIVIVIRVLLGRK